MYYEFIHREVKRLRGVPSKGPARRLVGIAVALSATVVVETAVRVAAGPGLFGGLTVDFLVGTATFLPFLVGVAYAGVWLAASDVDAARHGRVLWWTAGATLASVATNLVLMTVLPVTSTVQAFSWLRWAVAAGAGVGALVGVTEARAVQNASDAARSEARAVHFEQERDRLDYLNSLLRHEVLNAANEISGYASLLHEDSDPGSRVHEYSGRIDDRTDALTSVIDDVRVLLQASREPDAVDTVDAAAVSFVPPSRSGRSGSVS
jgi:signal transduction histidine kinase